MKFKILHLMASRIWTGPAETILNLAKKQAKAGHEVKVAIDRSETSINSEERALAYFLDSGLLLGGDYSFSAKKPGLKLIKDISFLRNCDFHIIHCHTSHDHFLASLSQVRKNKKAKIIRSFHKPSSRLMPGLRLDAYTYASIEIREKLKIDKPSNFLGPLIGEEFIKSSDKETLKKKIGLNAKIIIGMVSTLKKSRNHLLALEAFKLLIKDFPELKFVIIGDGQMEKILKSKVKKMRLDNSVIFAGYQSGKNYLKHLQCLDFVWILGLGNDWAGRAAAQAKACGASVIGADIGSLSNYADAITSLDANTLRNQTIKVMQNQISLPYKKYNENLLELYRLALNSGK